jgi:type II secretory pathway pseudopilin PulG
VPVQRGFALIALLALAALLSAFLIASALNLTGAGISNEREDRNMRALREAKVALIAYAASTEGWQAYMGQEVQPGGLPCPANNTTGASPGICSGAAQRVGRLPWATIGSNDFRDASGEQLWYAVSSNFYKNSANIINSDTSGLLTVTGTAPASNVVAIVFAPGPAIQDSTLPPGQIQDRSPANINRLASYLEGFTPVGSDYTFTTNALPTDTFNDRLLVITQAELMAVVEPAVAAQMERYVKPLIQEYVTKWGGTYPFAAPFVAPPALPNVAYRGATVQTMGLLPLTTESSWFRWKNATVRTIQKAGTGIYTGSSTISPDPTNCTISSSPSRATCQVNYPGLTSDDRPVIKLEIFLTNWNTAFADMPSPFTAPVDLTMTPNPGGSITLDKYGPWSFVSPDYPPTRSFVAQGTGDAVLTYIGRLQNADSTNNGVFITVPLPPPSYLTITSGDPAINPDGAWFIANQWYRQTYFAVSDDHLPGGSPPCTTGKTPSCLTVRNLPTPTNNKQAILVFAGRALDGQIRPGGLTNYFEGENSTPADLTFEHRAGLAGLSCAQFLAGTCPVPNAPYFINDRVVVLSP